ncbi:MAG: resolvase [Desulfobacca sp. 4484_104]|nr:MAG: resolvase [Desulfobacca sp. 4484_104]
MSDRPLRPIEVAKRLGVSRSTVYRWFWEGLLSGFKIGEGVLRIWESSVEKIIRERSYE